MKPGKILKLFKKGAKHVPKGSAGAVVSDFDWPSGMRIGVFGHANSGKTVYFTVLNEDCKVSKELGLSVTDNPTAGEFLANYRAIWGLGTSDSAGTMVDLREDKKFPPNTPNDKLLLFNAVVDRSKSIPVVTYDYNGKAVSIQDRHELADKVKDFMQGCQGILFFFDPKVLKAELQCQAHVASFVNMLEALAPGGKRPPVPVALVVTKADVLPGFTGENQTVLVRADQEPMLAEDYEIFLEQILSSHNIASNPEWAGSVREVLVKLKDLLKLIVGKTLDFQIFFTSSTGNPPIKIGTDVGRSLYKPPDKMAPVGVREPFYWLLKTIMRHRKLNAFRKVARWAMMLSLIFMVVWSAPHLYLFQGTLNRIRSAETDAWRDKQTISQIPTTVVREMGDRYESFSNGFFVKQIFTEFRAPGQELKQFYRSASTKDERTRLARRVGEMTKIVNDQARWPKVRPEGDSLIEVESITALETSVSGYDNPELDPQLYNLASEAMKLWRYWKEALVNRDSPEAWQPLQQQLELHKTQSPKPPPEVMELGTAMQAVIDSRVQQQKRTVQVKEKFTEYDEFVKRLRGSKDPQLLLVEAPRKLRGFLGALKGDPDRASDVEAVQKFLKKVKLFNKPRIYNVTVTGCEGHHVHIRVLPNEWPVGEQLRVGKTASLYWKAGDVIEIALHTKTHDKNGGEESWGEPYKGLQTLKGKTAIFKLTEPITISGVTVEFTFEDEDPRDLLPEF